MEIHLRRYQAQHHSRQDWLNYSRAETPLKKLLIWIGMMIMMMMAAIAMEECQRVQEKTNIPCNIISSYLPASCSQPVSIFNSSGNIVQVQNFGSYPPTCNTTFNITRLGTYQWNSSIESGTITVVEDSEMQIGLVIGIVSIVALFMWLAFKLEENHGILKLILIFTSIGLIFLIPSIFIIDNTNIIFQKAISIFTVIFWLYVAGFFVWWLFKKLEATVPR